MSNSPTYSQAQTKVTPIRVLIVDDKELFREGLVSLLNRRQEIEVVGQAEDGYQALELTRELSPQVILMDVDMPGCNGVRATELIKTEMSGPQPAIIMLTVSEEDKDLFSAIKAGAKGYLIKDVKIDELLKAIIVVNRGEAVISPSMAVKLLNEFNSAATIQPQLVAKHAEKWAGLSEREREVLKLVAVGSTNRDIATKLVISENTVKVHLHNILEKLHLRNRQHAAAYAIREGLVTDVEAAAQPDKWVAQD